MQTRRKTRLGIALAVLVGLGLTIGLTLYALSANIDLFYTPGRSCMAKRKLISGHITASVCGSAAMYSPAASSVIRRPGRQFPTVRRSRCGGGQLSGHSAGPLPRGAGSGSPGVLDGDRHITARQVLAKHDENYTPPEVKEALQPEKKGEQP